MPNAEIARRVGVARQTLISWRARYVAGGLAAPGGCERSGRRVHDDIAVVVATLEKPPAKLRVTHWSSRLLANQMGISYKPQSPRSMATAQLLAL